jgi:hypothetical protein
VNKVKRYREDMKDVESCPVNLESVLRLKQILGTIPAEQSEGAYVRGRGTGGCGRSVGMGQPACSVSGVRAIECFVSPRLLLRQQRTSKTPLTLSKDDTHVVGPHLSIFAHTGRGPHPGTETHASSKPPGVRWLAQIQNFKNTPVENDSRMKLGLQRNSATHNRRPHRTHRYRLEQGCCSRIPLTREEIRGLVVANRRRSLLGSHRSVVRQGLQVQLDKFAQEFSCW